MSVLGMLINEYFLFVLRIEIMGGFFVGGNKNMLFFYLNPKIITLKDNRER